jgi:hypothetical protein
MATTTLPTVVNSNVAVKLTGIASNGSIDFEYHVQVGEQKIRESAPRDYQAGEQIKLQFAATFDSGQTIHAEAQVRGYRGVSLQMVEAGRGLTADISHQARRQGTCFLLCLQSGQTSAGPCLTCPDGQNFARICC